MTCEEDIIPFLIKGRGKVLFIWSTYNNEQLNIEIVVMVKRRREKREIDTEGCKQDKILSSNVPT